LRLLLGNTGLVVDPACAKQITDAAVTLPANHDLGWRLGLEARRRAAQKLTMDGLRRSLQVS
jgi:hypothetical protein